MAGKPADGHPGQSSGSAGRAATLRAMPELLARATAVLATAAGGPGLTTRRVSGRTRALLLGLALRTFTVAGSKHDLKLIELVPLFIGALTV